MNPRMSFSLSFVNCPDDQECLMWGEINLESLFLLASHFFLSEFSHWKNVLPENYDDNSQQL